MSEIRKDIVTGEWTIIAVERGKRPHDFKKNQAYGTQKDCPFCPGNEHQTPPEVLAYRDVDVNPNEEKWNVRVVPNKYAAVKEKKVVETIRGFYETITGYGVHEVLIDTPLHESTGGQFSTTQIELILKAIKERYMEIAKNEKIKYIQVFKNQGADAGATLQHSHWQIIGVPLLPDKQRHILDGCKRYYQHHQKCVYCEMLRYEQDSTLRIIDKNDLFICFAPYASRFCYETWIMPKQHLFDYGHLSEQHITSLAQIIKRLLVRYEKVFDDISYNICFMGSPQENMIDKYFHWHIQILPRLTNIAGFELSTGCYINPSPPELVAETLRKVDIDEL